MKTIITNSDTVRIFWTDGDNNNRWDTVCVWVIEYFGLPGDKFTTELSPDWMDFKFKNKQDAVLMAMRWS